MITFIVIFSNSGFQGARVVIKEISWYVEIYTPNLENQQLVADQMVSEIPTEFYYEQRTVFRRVPNSST